MLTYNTIEIVREGEQTGYAVLAAGHVYANHFLIPPGPERGGGRVGNGAGKRGGRSIYQITW